MSNRPAISEEAIVLRGPLVTSFSDEEFFQFCQDNRDLRLERTSDHEIIFMSPAGFLSSSYSAEVVFQLSLWNKQTRLGRVGESSAAYVLPDKATLSPDASWFSQAAWARVPAELRNRFLPICPEFVVEVKSPSDRIPTLQAKMQQWLHNGTQLGFLLDCETETAWVYRPDQPAEELHGYDRHLSGEAVLPGFALDLRALREE
ncbi:Uma2 family endonuclease [Hymenobacter luteus]|uniref:Uma2 family endonuclease n=2 Tax=Hymenobacter TaxID=89966 RepID=A0A7W9T338_9BACT|nr:MULTISPECIES: Uma2 family endonuclease [Hymenobacter]MBB4602630.1 Uma2 family endonuclease [Hymenobacter latericoloratus]MBB6060521.1 Uma2 family endonuclease [Hymenobacter luteus]